MLLWGRARRLQDAAAREVNDSFPWGSHVARSVDPAPAPRPRHSTLLLAVLLGTLADSAAAQQAKLSTIGRELDWVGDDVVHVWTAPFRIHARDLTPLLAVTAPGVLLGVFDAEIQQWVTSREASWPVKLLGPIRERGALNHFGRTYVLVPVSVALFLIGAGTDDPRLRDAGLGCAAANVATTLPRATAARLIGRRRPLSGDGPYSFKPFTFNDWTYYSLPGGHAANIMACAAFWSHGFDLGAGEPLLYLFAVGLGAGRIVDQAHWASDTWLGLALGWAIGRLIADRMSSRRVEPAGARAQSFSVPLYIGWRFNF